MPIIGIGTDIVKISRIAKLLEKYPENFSQRILNTNEQIQFDKRNSKDHFLAKRFAAKEAFAKALGTGIAKGISFAEIEVSNDPAGKPELTLHGKALEISQQLGVKTMFVSLSDEKKYALAYVILEG